MRKMQKNFLVYLELEICFVKISDLKTLFHGGKGK